MNSLVKLKLNPQGSPRLGAERGTCFSLSSPESVSEFFSHRRSVE
jgi:hypothetical protein